MLKDMGRSEKQQMEKEVQNSAKHEPSIMQHMQYSAQSLTTVNKLHEGRECWVGKICYEIW